MAQPAYRLLLRFRRCVGTRNLLLRLLRTNNVPVDDKQYSRPSLHWAVHPHPCLTKYFASDLPPISHTTYFFPLLDFINADRFLFNFIISVSSSLFFTQMPRCKTSTAAS